MGMHIQVAEDLRLLCCHRGSVQRTPGSPKFKRHRDKHPAAIWVTMRPLGSHDYDFTVPLWRNFSSRYGVITIVPAGTRALLSFACEMIWSMIAIRGVVGRNPISENSLSTDGTLRGMSSKPGA